MALAMAADPCSTNLVISLDGGYSPADHSHGESGTPRKPRPCVQRITTNPSGVLPHQAGEELTAGMIIYFPLRPGRGGPLILQAARPSAVAPTPVSATMTSAAPL